MSALPAKELKAIRKEIMAAYFLPDDVRYTPEFFENSRKLMHHNALVSNLAVRKYAGQREAEKIPPKVTGGSLRGAVIAFVYVGTKGRLIKIGMSGSPQKRCRSLGCAMQYAIPVVPSAAKTVETFALQALGATIEDDEWVDCTVEDAIAAVKAAWLKSSNLRHTDPDMTEDEARLDRVSRAIGSGINA